MIKIMSELTFRRVPKIELLSSEIAFKEVVLMLKLDLS
jgi:hypothetical protein